MTPARVSVIGLPWAILWLGFWAIVFVVIGILDPASIDPGEGLVAMIAILGPMGLLSGVAFGTILLFRGRPGTSVDLSAVRVTGQGMLGCAIVQMAYLGHGDAGLAANIIMALLFSAFGGVVTLVWLVMARKWAAYASLIYGYR